MISKLEESRIKRRRKCKFKQTEKGRVVRIKRPENESKQVKKVLSMKFKQQQKREKVTAESSLKITSR
jgi:hypothetical protein